MESAATKHVIKKEPIKQSTKSNIMLNTKLNAIMIKKKNVCVALMENVALTANVLTRTVNVV